MARWNSERDMLRKCWRWLVGGDDWNYVKAIAVLKTDRPLSLPAVQPLRAVKVKGQKRRARVANFSRGKL